SEATNTLQQPNIQPQIITTVSNNDAKFPYLKKDECEVWAMKIEYWITNNDMNIWKVIQNGNSLKRTRRDSDRRVIILPSTIVDEHITVQRESKARTTLLQFIPDDHVADFHYMDDARDIWNAVKARFNGNAESKKMRKSMLKQEFSEFRIGEAEGLHKGHDRMQNILSQLNQLKAKPEDKDINLKFLRALPSSWSQVALTLKTKGGLELLSFDDLYYKLKTLETVSHRSSNVIKDILHSFVADIEPEQQLAYEDFEQIEKLDLEEMDLKWKMAMLSVRVHKFKQKARRKINFDKKESARFNKKKVRCYKCQQRGHFATLVDWTDHDGESDGVIAFKEFGMIAGCDIEDAIEEGFNNYIRENELGWDDSAFSLFTTDSEDVDGRPLFNRFAKADSMKAMPPPLSGNYISLSDNIDLDESHMSYGTKSSTSSDSKFVSNDFVSCNDSDKSLEVNTNNFASSDSSVKSSEPKPNDSTSCASTSSVSTSENEAEIESNVGTPIQEPIIVQDLPSFSCNSSKMLHMFLSYVLVEPVHSRKKVNHQNQFVSQTVLLRTGKVNIPPARPQPVPTGKPKVFAPVPSGRQNRPFPVPIDRGYSPSVISGWWKRIDGQLLLSPQQVVLGNHIEKENTFLDAEDEGVFDSGCSRSMTGNKERLDDFQEFQGGKVTFGGGEARITGKWTIQTPTLDFENVYYVKELQQFNLGNLSCLVAHASVDESVKWHRRMGHENYKNMNRLVKGNLVRGLPPKLFKNDHTCVACCKGKAMRCDNGTEFKNAHIIELCGSKGIKREYSNARTLQKNRVAERNNRTLIEAARTMLVDSKLSTMFWTQAVRTACYVLNRVLVTSPHNKTPYALLTGNILFVSHLKPFGCHVTILNTSDHLGNFDGNADEGYIVGYSMLKSLLSNKEKLLELENTPLNENCSAVILKKLPEKLGDPGKLLISCGFSELKCKALADLGDSINLVPLSVWKKLGLPELISTRMTLELANRAICTPDEIAKDVFVPVGKFTFPTDFVNVDYESDPRVPLILERLFLRTARALIDVHREEMILCDGDERLTLNMRHDTSSYSNQPQKESINMINIYNDSYEDYLEDFDNPTSSSPDHLLVEFADELALITFPPGNNDLPFDIESDLREIEYLLNHDPTKEMDSILEDSDPFDSKDDKIKESKLLIDELDPPRSSDFLPSLECDSVLYEDFSKFDALPSTDNEEKVFNS
nr:ribonuclease H-like domain-containing protein [Tanacetum cinerariifolium]